MQTPSNQPIRRLAQAKQQKAVDEALEDITRLCNERGLAFVGAVATCAALDGHHYCRMIGHAAQQNADTATLVLDCLGHLSDMRDKLIASMD